MVTQQRTTREQAAQVLVDRYIYFDPLRPGLDEAKLRTYHISVWAIIGCLSGPDSSIATTADDYDIPVEAVRAAVAYYERYKAVIDNRLLANEWPHEVIYGEFSPRPEYQVPTWDSP